MGKTGAKPALSRNCENQTTDAKLQTVVYDESVIWQATIVF